MEKKQLTTYPHTLAAGRSTCGGRLPSTPPLSPPAGDSPCCSRTPQSRRCRTLSPCAGQTEACRGPGRAPGRTLDSGRRKKKNRRKEKVRNEKNTVSLTDETNSKLNNSAMTRGFAGLHLPQTLYQATGHFSCMKRKPAGRA